MRTPQHLLPAAKRALKSTPSATALARSPLPTSISPKTRTHLRLVHVLGLKARGVEHRLRSALALGLRDPTGVLVERLGHGVSAIAMKRVNKVEADLR